MSGGSIQTDERGEETDESLRTRIANKYGMWGAFLSVVMGSHGRMLDDCAKHVGLKRGTNE